MSAIFLKDTKLMINARHIVSAEITGMPDGSYKMTILLITDEIEEVFGTEPEITNLRQRIASAMKD